MGFSPESIDPPAMSTEDVRSIANDGRLLQAYGPNIVAEAAAAARAAYPGEAAAVMSGLIYDTLRERVSDDDLVEQLMHHTGEYAAMHQRVLDRHVAKNKPLKGGLQQSQSSRVTRSTKEQPMSAETSQANQGTAEKYIGSMMPRPEWEVARDAVSNPGKHDGWIYLPRPGADYAGKILTMTETHLVQQVGTNRAITHELAKLENGAELAKQYDDKKIGPKTHIVIRYGQDRGEGEVIPFTVKLANEVKEKGQVWAEANIGNTKSRDAFLKHLDNFTKEMAKGISLKPQQPAPARVPERSQQIERPR